MNFPPGKNLKVLDVSEEISGTMSFVKGLCANWMVSEGSSYMPTCIEDIEQICISNIEIMFHKLY